MKKYLFATVVVAIGCILRIPKYKNNVCKTFEDYYTDRDSNKNCYYNPDIALTVPQIIQRNGYPLETYEAVTLDGYILTIFRIPYGKHSKRGKLGKPVFLQHGAHGNSGCFVNIGSKSLAFILADKGYDVWLGNARGTKYSLNHLNFDHAKDRKYWDFTIDEYGGFDLPAEINTVYSITNQKIVYIGHSLGTTNMYVYISLHPEAAFDRIELFINLAPATFFGENYFTLPKLASVFYKYAEPLLKIVSNGDILSPYLLPVEVLNYLCLPFPFQIKLCLISHILVLGSSYCNVDPETIPITFIHNCDRSSIKTWGHMAQLWYKQTFEQYDYGKELNLQRYGAVSPPHYNLSKINVPLYFICAQSDLLTTEMDVNKLYDALPEDNKPEHVYIIQEGYAHLDLILAKDVVPLVFDQIIKILSNLS